MLSRIFRRLGYTIAAARRRIRGTIRVRIGILGCERAFLIGLTISTGETKAGVQYGSREYGTECPRPERNFESERDRCRVGDLSSRESGLDCWRGSRATIV